MGIFKKHSFSFCKPEKTKNKSNAISKKQARQSQPNLSKAVNTKEDTNVIFSNAYNTLDNFLKNLIDEKSEKNLIWYLEKVSFLDDYQKSQLKTLRKYKNDIVSHGVVPNCKRPSVPKEWVIFLNDLYVQCQKERYKLKNELSLIIRNDKKHFELPNHENKKSFQKAPPCDLEHLWKSFLRSVAKDIADYEHFKFFGTLPVRCYYTSGLTFNSRYNNFGGNYPMTNPCFDNNRNYAFYEIPCNQSCTYKGRFLFLAWDFHGCAIFGEMNVTNIYTYMPTGYYEVTKLQYENYIRKTHYGKDCTFGNFKNCDNAFLNDVRRRAKIIR